MNPGDISAALIDKLQDWLATLILLLPNFVLAVIVVMVAALAARLARRAVQGILGRMSTTTTVTHLLATLSYVAVLAIGLFIALGVIGLDRAVTSLLAGVGIIGIALGFAFQDLASNFIAGVLLSVRRPFLEGDLIGHQDFKGIVTEINLRSTRLRTLDGQIVIIPNADVFTNPVTNYSTGERRVDLHCGVAYGDNLEEAREVVLSAIRNLDFLLPDRDIEFYYEEFGDSSIDFVTRFWISFSREPDYLRARSEAVIAIKRALDEAGLTIPFPIRTLDFSEVGGQRLDQTLPRRFYDDAGNGRSSVAGAS